MLNWFFIILGSIQTQAFTLTYDNMKGYDREELVFDYNTTNCPADIIGSIEAAIELWNTVETSKLTVKKGSLVGTSVAQAQTPNAGNPVVVCDPSFSNGNSLAGQGASYSLGGTLVGGFIIINANSSTSQYWSNLSSTLREIAMTHEMGHVLGLGHSKDSESLMYYNGGLKEKLNLSQDDVDGITYLYPRDELSGDVLGCGRIAKNSANPYSQNWPFLLLLPILLVFSLRTKHR